jgi:hypothetical protein
MESVSERAIGVDWPIWLARSPHGQLCVRECCTINVMLEHGAWFLCDSSMVAWAAWAPCVSCCTMRTSPSSQHIGYSRPACHSTCKACQRLTLHIPYRRIPGVRLAVCVAEAASAALQSRQPRSSDGGSHMVMRQDNSLLTAIATGAGSVCVRATPGMRIADPCAGGMAVVDFTVVQ